MPRTVRSPYDENKQWLDNSRSEANQIPVGSEMAFGGDVAEPDLYIGSAADLFNAILQSSLTGDQFIVAFFGTVNNRFGAQQIVMETTDFSAPGLQVASYTRGVNQDGAAGVVSMFGDSGSSGGTQPGAGGFIASPTMLGSRDVTLGVGFRAVQTGSFSTGRFIDYAGFYTGDLNVGDNTGVAYAFRTLINGAGNFAVSAEGDAPSRFIGAKFLLPNLPTADPAVAGQLWVDVAAGRVIKQSAG